MGTLIEKIIEVVFEPILNFFKLWFLGYDKAEVINMKKSISYVYLLDTMYLKRRKLSFLFKTNILCLIATVFIVYIMPNIATSIVYTFLSNIAGVDKTEIQKSLYMIIMPLSNLIIFMLIAICITESFRNHLYGGYETEIRGLNTSTKYVKMHLFVVLVYFILNILQLKIIMYFKIIEIICYLVAIAVFLYCWVKKTGLYKSSQLRVKVRERGSEIYENGHETIDGEKDIKVIFNDTNMQPMIVNVFKENFYIVANNNILILGKDKNILYAKNKIKEININNGDTLDIHIKYVQAENKWKVM